LKTAKTSPFLATVNESSRIFVFILIEIAQSLFFNFHLTVSTMVGRRQMIPVLRDQVLATEAKRGTGVDLTLRQHMGKLEITLGISKS
jgi:hypothetical protein